MKTIYLLRHAKSSWDDPGVADFDRPISGRGKRSCGALARAIAELHVAPELILCSSAKRTQETLRRIASALPHDHMVAVERQLYLASARKLLARLRRVPDDTRSVMLIGHNPGLQRLAEMLAGGGEKAALARLAAKFPTAGLVELEYPGADWRSLEESGAKLVRLWSPSEEEKSNE